MIYKIINFGCKTNHFGVEKIGYEESEETEIISQEELFQIDKNIGYAKNGYSDIAFELLKNEMKDTGKFKEFLRSQGIDISRLNAQQILKYKMQFINTYIKYRDKTGGPYERKCFYIKLTNNVLNKIEGKNFEVSEYVKDTLDDVDVIFCIGINLDEEPTYFYYSEENQSYVTIEKNELEELTRDYKVRGKDIMKTEVNKNRNDSNDGEEPGI